MKLLRSWPRHPPPGRAHVIDGLERVIIDGYDYRRLVNHGDVVLVEWDLAVDPEQLATFITRAAASPGAVRVAPYRLYYQYADDPWNPHQPVWAHRRIENDRVRWVVDSDTSCHFFGFGLTYLPGELVAQYCAADAGPLGDDSFSKWHHRHVTPEVPIDWDIRPVHLNHPPIKES